jgi:hypothetical protein
MQEGIQEGEWWRDRLLKQATSAALGRESIPERAYKRVGGGGTGCVSRFLQRPEQGEHMREGSHEHKWG